jgi:hypothetical protein
MTVAGVLRRDEIDLAEYLNGALRNIVEISDGRCDNIQSWTCD